MHFFVTLTSDCNLKCNYCYGKCCDDLDNNYGNFGEIDYSMPNNITYNTDLLESLSQRITIESILFYGGEPLLKIDKIKEIMDRVPAQKFLMQTNGLLLKDLESSYLRKLHTILVSIDGNQDITDAYRGDGVYESVINNVHNIRERGFRGELIARMTVGQKTKIDEQVTHLLFNEDCFFDSIHWQLDAQFWVNDFNPESFANWVQYNYGPRLSRLIEIWVNYMQEKGKVLKIYPLIGIVQTLLKDETNQLRCGSGWIQFNIQTDGNIVPCPVMSGLKDYYLGNIENITSDDLKYAKVRVGKPCTECNILNVCGGRCLYANITKLWGDDGFQQVCRTVTKLIEEVKHMIPKIQSLEKESRISYSDFKYTKFNSCEIIP
jgi:putative peptide-modifying radical SAM enzyme